MCRMHGQRVDMLWDSPTLVPSYGLNSTTALVDKYMYLGKTVTRVGDLLPEIKRHIALGLAAFSKVANTMKSRKAILHENNEELPVMMYSNETWALKRTHMYGTTINRSLQNGAHHAKHPTM